MNTSLINASVSMTALQRKLDLIGNNIANLNTQGYKRQEVSFTDVLTSVKEQTEEFNLAGRRSPLGITETWGARLNEVQVDFSQGSLLTTDLPLDIAIEGNALIELAVPRIDATGNAMTDAEGGLITDRMFTHGGSFKLSPIAGDNLNAHLSTQDGHLVRDRITNEPILIPKDHRVVIDQNGAVTVYNDRIDSSIPVTMGTIPLVLVNKPELLMNAGANLYRLPTEHENTDIVVQAIDLNMPRTAETRDINILQGFIEQSNVVLADEMSELMIVQRAYQLNARALTSADKMMETANNLRG